MKASAKIRAKYVNLSNSQKKIIIYVITFIIILFTYAILHKCYILIFPPQPPIPSIMIRHGSTIEIPSGSPLRSQIEIKVVRLSEKPHIISFPGFVEANPALTVNILPPLAGRLMSMKVGVGEQVESDQILAEISSPDFTQAFSDHEKALSTFKLASDLLNRAKGVLKIGGNSLQSVQQAQNDYLLAQAELTRAANKLKTLNNDGNGLLTIHSPIKGRVTALNYGIGSYINDLDEPLMSISNIEHVWVTAHIPESVAGLVKKEQSVDIHLPAYPKKIFHGKVNFVNAFLEPDTRRNKTRIVLSNPNGKLQPNMFATVDIRIKQTPQIIIPISAVVMNNDTTSVYVESSPWICERREIELGYQDGEHVRVISGLKAGERIVTCGGMFINDK